MSFKKVNIFTLGSGTTGVTLNYDSVNMIYDFSSNQLISYYSDGTSKVVSSSSGSTNATLSDNTFDI